MSIRGIDNLAYDPNQRDSLNRSKTELNDRDHVRECSTSWINWMFRLFERETPVFHFPFSNIFLLRVPTWNRETLITEIATNVLSKVRIRYASASNEYSIRNTSLAFFNKVEVKLHESEIQIFRSHFISAMNHNSQLLFSTQSKSVVDAWFIGDNEQIQSFQILLFVQWW